MKALRAFILIIAATAIVAAMAGAFLLKRGVAAQSQHPAQLPPPAEDRGVLGQYERLIFSLSRSGDTNSAAEVAKLVTAMQTGHATIDLAMNVRILENLRSGHTNEAMQLLETGLNGAVMSFYGSSGNQRDENQDAVLRMAKEYRRKYPSKESAEGTNSVVEQVFESVPK